MKKKVYLYAGLVVAALGFSGAALAVGASGSSSGAKSSPGKTIVLPTFDATVYYGPDAGLSLNGTLTLHRDASGALTGVFARTSGAPVPVSGQWTGRAVNLIFYIKIGAAKHMFGAGTAGQDPSSGQLFLGGPLVGPRAADSGEWASYIPYK